MLQSVAFSVGVGKTHLACALGHIAVRRRRTVHMAPAAKLFKRLKAARLDNTLEAEMRRLAGVELLIVDLSGVPSHPSVTSAKVA
jgi:DNA replication protein DnaC